MKKTYKIEVDCANCALKMEEATKKVEGVQDATVNFMTQKMKVEFAEIGAVSAKGTVFVKIQTIGAGVGKYAV